jgi:hypothetical protein
LRPDVSVDLEVTGVSRWAWGLVLMAVATASGCWKEVDYNPATRPPRQSSADADAGDLGQGDSEIGEPKATDIFGGDDGEGSTNATAVDTAPIEPAIPPVSSSNDPPTKTPVTGAERLAAWNLANNWALSAAMAGRGLPAERYAKFLQQASAAAQELGLVLPELPAPPDAEQLAADMATALRAGTGAALAEAVGDRLDAAAAGAARLAITAHVLLLVYTPLEADAPTLARELREAGVASRLPPELWQPLVDLVSRRSLYEPVKTAVLALPKNVAKHYADAAAGGL